MGEWNILQLKFSFSVIPEIYVKRQHTTDLEDIRYPTWNGQGKFNITYISIGLVVVVLPKTIVKIFPRAYGWLSNRLTSRNSTSTANCSWRWKWWVLTRGTVQIYFPKYQCYRGKHCSVSLFYSYKKTTRESMLSILGRGERLRPAAATEVNKNNWRKQNVKRERSFVQSHWKLVREVALLIASL